MRSAKSASFLVDRPKKDAAEMSFSETCGDKYCVTLLSGTQSAFSTRTADGSGHGARKFD